VGRNEQQRECEGEEGYCEADLDPSVRFRLDHDRELTAADRKDHPPDASPAVEFETALRQAGPARVAMR